VFGSGIFLAGCFENAKLETAPASIAFSSGQLERRLTLSNSGARAFDWSLDTLVRDSEDDPWREESLDWLIPSKSSGTLKPGVENLTLSIDPMEMLPGVYRFFAARITAPGGERIVPISVEAASLLIVEPAVIQLDSNRRSASFEIRNTSEITLHWEARYFDGKDPANSVDQLPDDLVLTPDTGSLSGNSSVSVEVSWTEPREDFGLLISSPEIPGHEAVVLFRFGYTSANLDVSPQQLTLFFSRPPSGSGHLDLAQSASLLTLRNTGTENLSWTISAVALEESDTEVGPVIAVTPSAGLLIAGASEEVEVQVVNPGAAIPGAGNYELVIHLTAYNEDITVPLRLEARALPEIMASDPPNPNLSRPESNPVHFLDFGLTEIQKEFYVLNAGPRDSDLFFKIVHDDLDVDRPLIKEVAPLSGNTNTRPGNVFFLPGSNDMVDAASVLVTVDRAAMTEDVEYRDLYIEAWNKDGTEAIAGVEPWKIELRVERPPMTIEGAINRGRPPFLMRFVFLLRDTLGQVIPTQSVEDRARLRFEIFEDEVPLDLNETTMQITGPESLTANIVLLLDYSGSMYYAGTESSRNPKKPGEVLKELRQATAQFLDDLPPTWRVALMCHYDRQSANRLIYPFSSDREALKTALFDFEVPASLHGTSDIWNAVEDAMKRTVAQDAEDTLPFDEADIRAVLFVTDGIDNSSTGKASEILSYARDNRVRLYPLVYNVGSPVNFGDVLTLANDSGGHFYNANTPEDLIALLGNREGLVLTPVKQQLTAHDREIRFEIENAGQSKLTWDIAIPADAPWIKSITPASGTLMPEDNLLVTINVDPEFLETPLGEGHAVLEVTSTRGVGSIHLSYSVGDDGVSTNRLAVDLFDAPGIIWGELQNQIVLSYVTPLQRAGKYSIRAFHAQPDGSEISNYFEEDGVFYMGDVRAGQLSMETSGINFNNAAATLGETYSAEVFVRADYVPRGVNSFRLRFMPLLPYDAPEELAEAFDLHEMTVALAPQGLLLSSSDGKPDWRLVAEGDGVYTLLTSDQYPLAYGAFGNLLRIEFTNLQPFFDKATEMGIEPEFYLDMRGDNSIYYNPATPNQPSTTVYFLYPSGPKNPNRPLLIAEGLFDFAAPALTVLDLANPDIDPEQKGGIWDRDGDTIPDFNDPFPDDDKLPGKITEPETIRFVKSGSKKQPLTLMNNRWGRFTIKDIVISSSSGELSPNKFSWLLAATDAVFNIESLKNTVLLPGDKIALQLSLDTSGLSSGSYRLDLRITTDLFVATTIPIFVEI